ncbi:MAG: chemotaxis protein CheW, partial [Lentisphaerae bacterium]|nr:chemotaxis protein CheW [Lentisphaerota bacterium]
MRSSRIKAEGLGYYHCMSRVVDRRMILGDVEREKFRDLMRGAETFCGVRVVTYAILSNHFHILAEVPDRQEVSEAEVVARLAAIYDRQTVLGMLSQWELWRKQGLEKLVQGDLERLRARMYDVSEFLKTVKQRFSQWYNR